MTANTTARTAMRSRATLWFAFAAVHAALIAGALPNGGDIFNDVRLYGRWARDGLDSGFWPVFDETWVYPIGALGPVVGPAVFTTSQNAYIVAYTLLVVAVDGLALWALLRAARGRTLAGWWWLAFLLATGPIAVTRLDGISAALTVIALAALAWPAGRLLRTAGERGAFATVLATLGAWIKVAPGAAVLAMACTMRRPLRRVIAPAAVVSAVLILFAEAGGAGGRVFGFAADQGTRGLQVESALATFFSVARLWSDQIVVFFDQEIITWEIMGPGTQAVASAANAVLLVAVVATCALVLRARRRLGPAERLDDGGRPGDGDSRARLDLLLLATMAITLLLFVLNKVGSPQYVVWFAPPVAVALAVRGRERAGRGREAAPRRWRWDLWSVLAVGLLVVGALTQWLYPIAYDWFLAGRGFEIAVEALRNLLTVVLAVACLVALARWRPSDVTGSGEPECAPDGLSADVSESGARQANATGGEGREASTGPCAPVERTS